MLHSENFSQANTCFVPKFSQATAVVFTTWDQLCRKMVDCPYVVLTSQYIIPRKIPGGSDGYDLSQLYGNMVDIPY